MIFFLKSIFSHYVESIILYSYIFFKVLFKPWIIITKKEKILYLLTCQRYSKINHLTRIGKNKKALEKIINLDNKTLMGKIGITKSSLYFLNGEYQKATQLAQKMIPLIEKTDKYNQADKEYLTFYLKDIMLDCEVTSKENFEKLKLELVNWYIDLSKVDKILMRWFPMRDLGNWYKHNPKDEYYEETIAKYGEE